MKGFHSPEEEGSWEIIHDEKEKEKVKEEPEPTKGNATAKKGWRTVNALSD